jgi:hypothetical protein
MAHSFYFCVPQPEPQYYDNTSVSPGEESTGTRHGNEQSACRAAVEYQHPAPRALAASACAAAEYSS